MANPGQANHREFLRTLYAANLGVSKVYADSHGKLVFRSSVLGPRRRWHVVELPRKQFSEGYDNWIRVMGEFSAGIPVSYLISLVVFGRRRGRLLNQVSDLLPRFGISSDWPS